MKKIAILGKGYWGSIIGKYADKYFDVKYIADSKFDRKIIWNDDEVEAVLIITPIETHYNLTKEALKNGKSVYVEKPVTTRLNQAIELAELADSKNLKLCVEYTQTFSPSINKIVKIIREYPEELKYIEMSVKHLGRFLTHDVYWLLASHQLSILGLVYDLNELTFENTDVLSYNSLCTTGFISFKGKDQLLQGRIDVSTNFPGKEMFANFYFQNATVKYNPLAEKSVSFTEYNNKFHELPPVLTEREDFWDFDEKNNLNASLGYFKDVLAGKEKQNIDLSIQITKILEKFANQVVS